MKWNKLIITWLFWESRLFSANQSYLKCFKKALIGWKKDGLSKRPLVFKHVNRLYMTPKWWNSNHKNSSHKNSSHKNSSHKNSNHKNSNHKNSSHKNSNHKNSNHKTSKTILDIRPKFNFCELNFAFANCNTLFSPYLCYSHHHIDR